MTNKTGLIKTKLKLSPQKVPSPQRVKSCIHQDVCEQMSGKMMPMEVRMNNRTTFLRPFNTRYSEYKLPVCLTVCLVCTFKLCVGGMPSVATIFTPQ